MNVALVKALLEPKGARLVRYLRRRSHRRPVQSWRVIYLDGRPAVEVDGAVARQMATRRSYMRKVGPDSWRMLTPAELGSLELRIPHLPSA